ncbi:flagellar hook-associated protein FlgK [Bacillus sp. CECT 9360]|uniref:flagellar hook-associated protein FlgK n=1 Tax=Bacillus sp. CECT 9360 TaxID=2845821 RepID=UPI001E53F704|nr:flagellar hook-associated protein FlgK [Bacillus sp. CECT 9360]CAH0344854.1 hypothetical protein BCI9360_01124 [Bacillus sp. CECT 9360]
MRSTFMGLETAKRGMSTQQSALYTTGHNISNANTPGFSRQRVNFATTTPYPGVGMNRPQIPGQIGTGVEAGTVQRIREGFLDLQFRTENTKVGYYGTLSESLTKMEEIMNEPTESGLHSTMEKFWNSLQTLSSHTENSGARDVVAETGQMVADTLNYYYNSLDRIRGDLNEEIVQVKQSQINTLIGDIHDLNDKISQIEPNGYITNDLYDQRDLLVDNLSKMVNIKVTKVTPNNYGNAKPMAEGLYNIELLDKNSNSYNPPIVLVEANKTVGVVGRNTMGVNLDANGGITSLHFNGQIVTDIGGELGGFIESYQVHYPQKLKELNDMTRAFANEFNRIHALGYGLGDTAPSGINFFDGVTAGDPNPAQSIKVNQVILDSPNKIAAGQGNGDSGNNLNALELANLKTKNFSLYQPAPTLNGSVDTFYSGVIGKLGVLSQSMQKNNLNATILADSVEKNRQSVSAVSLDEEMTNMIKFQHAYNASARNITVVDEMLDKIINGMGVVGR